MRICFIMPFFYRDKPSGAEIQSFMIARELVSRGYDISYLCERLYKDAPEEEIVEGIKVFRKLKNFKIFQFLNFFPMLTSILHLKPFIYYQRMASPYTGLVGILSKLTGGKFIWACTEDATLHKNHFIELKLRHFKGYSGNFIKRILLLSDAVINQLLFGLGVRLANVCVVQNTYQKQKLYENDKRNGIIIKSGHIPAKGKIEKDNPPIVLWLNGISKRKQPELFIELARECQDVHCKFIMIGGTDKIDYLNTILSKAKELQNFKYLGKIPFEETNQWFRRASIYVNTTTEGREGFPNCFIQAFFNECVVLSLSVDPDEILTKNKIGFCCGTIDKMQKVLRILINDSELAKEMAKNARINAEREYNIYKIVDDYELIIRTCFKRACVR